MRRFGSVALCLLLGVALVCIGVLFARVESLERRLQSVSRTTGALARESAAARKRDAYPVTVDVREPAVTFENQADLARYTVRIHDKLEALSSAMERDIHAVQDSGRGSPMPLTHAVIDGKRLSITPPPQTAEFLGTRKK